MYITDSYSCWQSGRSVNDMATDKGNRDIIDLLSRQTAVSNPNVSYKKGQEGGHRPKLLLRPVGEGPEQASGEEEKEGAQ